MPWRCRWMKLATSTWLMLAAGWTLTKTRRLTRWETRFTRHHPVIGSLQTSTFLAMLLPSWKKQRPQHASTRTCNAMWRLSRRRSPRSWVRRRSAPSWARLGYRNLTSMRLPMKSGQGKSRSTPAPKHGRLTVATSRRAAWLAQSMEPRNGRHPSCWKPF